MRKYNWNIFILIIFIFAGIQDSLSSFPGDRKEGYTCPAFRSQKCKVQDGNPSEPDFPKMPGNPPGINESCGSDSQNDNKNPIHDPDHHFSMFGDSDQHHSPFFVIKERRAKKMPARRLTSCKPARGMSE